MKAASTNRTNFAVYVQKTLMSDTRRYSIKLGFLGLGAVLFALSVAQLVHVRYF